MYTLGKEFLLVIKVKISIVFTIHAQENSISPETFLGMSNIDIIEKPSATIVTTRKMTRQKLTMLSLRI